MCYSQSILIVRISPTLTEAVHQDLSQYIQLVTLFSFLTVLLLIKQSITESKQ